MEVKYEFVRCSRVGSILYDFISNSSRRQIVCCCPDRKTSLSQGVFIVEITYLVLYVICLVKIDVKNWPDNVHGGRERHGSNSSLDLGPTFLGTTGLVVGLVPVSFERGTLEGCGLRQLLGN